MKELKELRSRRMKLAKAIAHAAGYKINGDYITLEKLEKTSDWARLTYAFGEVRDYDSFLLRQDLSELSRLKWIEFHSYVLRGPDGGSRYCPDCRAWKVTLLQDGLDAITEHEKTAFKKAYEKQPVTFWQLLITLLTAFVGVCGTIGGYFVGLNQNNVEKPPIVSPTTHPTTNP